MHQLDPRLFRLEFRSGLYVVANKSICYLHPTHLSLSLSLSRLSWLKKSSFSHFSLQSRFEKAQLRRLKLLWDSLFGRTCSIQTLTNLNDPSTKSPSSAQDQGTSYCNSNAFQSSTINLDLQWAHCLSEVLSGRLRRWCIWTRRFSRRKLALHRGNPS